MAAISQPFDPDLTSPEAGERQAAQSRRKDSVLAGRRAAVVVFSHYPSDPRPRRAAEALVESGMDVEVLCLSEGGRALPQQLTGVKVTQVPLKHWRGGACGYLFQYGAFLLAAFFWLSLRAPFRRFSLVHIHNMPDILVFAALVPKLMGARVILDLHDPMPELLMTIFSMRERSFGVRMLKFLEKCSIAFADLVLTPNESFRKLFVDRTGSDRKLRVVMNSPDEGIFRFRETPAAAALAAQAERPFVLMYHGALVHRHGLDLAVDALAKASVSAPKLELRVFGKRTPYLDEILAKVRGRGGRGVSYLGPKTLPQIAEAIDACDVGIIPNRPGAFIEINLPTRIFEYLARGKAVIAPRTRGIRDYFGEEELIYFRPGDVDDLAEKIQFVCNHPDQARAIAGRGQAVYRRHLWGQERDRFLAYAGGLVR